MPYNDVLRGRGGSGLLDRLDRWVADARLDEAVRARSRERDLRDASAQELTLAGTLLDLAERRETVTVRTASGRAHAGWIEVVGVDFAAVRLARGASALIPHTAIRSVRSQAEREVLGDRSASTDLRLLDVLAELATDREAVLVAAADDRCTVRGRLRAAGRDIVSLRAAGQPPSTVYVPASAITEVIMG